MPEKKNCAQRIAEKFGGVRALQRATKISSPGTVGGWIRRGWVPGKQQKRVMTAARRLNIELSNADFYAG